MIAVRGGDYATRGLIGRKQRDLVGCAAQFEGAGELQVLELKVDVEANSCGRLYWRLTDVRLDAGVGCFDSGSFIGTESSRATERLVQESFEKAQPRKAEGCRLA